MEKRKQSHPLTIKQKEAIAEQLSDFFFGYWENRSASSNKNDIGRKSKATASTSGLLRNFPETKETVA